VGRLCPLGIHPCFSRGIGQIASAREFRCPVGCGECV
jgi:hypothetical protein